MITPWQMYLITRLDGLIDAAGISLALTVIVFWALVFVGCLEDKVKDFTPWLKRLGIVCLCLVPVIVLTPRSKQLAAIILVPALVNSEHAQEIPDKVLEALALYLGDQIKDMEDIDAHNKQ